MVDIVIPIYKKDPTLDDTTAINQAFKLLKGYDITFVHPKSLDITNYKEFGEATFKAFNDTYFESIYGYNQLILKNTFLSTKLMPLFSKTTSIIGVKKITTI